MNMRLWFGLVFWVLGVFEEPAWARTWTEAGTGKKIEAELVSADSAAVRVKVAGGRTYDLPLARLSAEDQAFVREQLAGKAGAIQAVAGERVKEDRFKAVENLVADEIPVSGRAHKALGVVDEAIRGFMVEKGIGSLTFAVSSGGKVLHDRAYGWADADLKMPLQPGVKMRLASMTKPVVKAAVQTLVADGKLKLEAGVFDLLELSAHPEAREADPRWSAVTIQHLLDHQGGWDRDVSGDFTTASASMESLFGVKTEALEPMHVVRYGLTKKMDFDPGEREAYCNYGYILLVRVIEKVSGQAFVDYLQGTVCKQAQAPSFSLSTSDARDRQPGEIWYCYHPEYPAKQVPLSFRTEARDGAGVLACTAADYCRFLETYWISGLPRKPGAQFFYSFSGSHPGVTAICAQRRGGVSYAAIANRRGGGKTDWNGELRKVIEAGLAAAGPLE
jgi:hypothetical protein